MSQENEVRAEAQWVDIEIFAENMNVTVKGVSLKWGKFHKPGNKGSEVKISDIEGHVIPAGTSYRICSSGRANASSGTEGEFKLYDGDIELAKYYWDCPWGSKKNKDDFKPTSNTNYKLNKTGGNYESGALGNINIICIKVR
ncbi:hypothetical protein Xsto_01704 [Xenorhabdus stockiae]|uniref:Aegerolysin n=1 Tax=Xenorhabdus stockiae TaxID=351614 RepID=A0A2D0KQR3_9GAMM|nr:MULTISPECIES: aegerolysin family protein [Xenorhabdus]PHM65759.1 hypothetical protein Xsto_01704 [Xenorhabdus stockiae]PHM68427.1 hypothetical protein Xekj_03370 [Xenorhabdus sp. KJ12.1]